MEVKPLKAAGNATAVIVILLLSGAVFAFLIWLIYFKPRLGSSSTLIASLPAANAFFNSLSATFLLLGLRAIKRGDRQIHMKWMLSALFSSALFLTSYVTYHAFHGDTPFPGRGWVRPIYFFILITHIVLSALAVPLILSSFYFALSERLSTHRRVSRFTFPVWLYVSVTGVLIFALLRLYS